MVAYKCDEVYDKSSEDGIYLFDNELNIDWKIPAHEAVLSEKDQNQKKFSEFEPIDL